MADDYKNGTFAAADCARPLTRSPDASRSAPIVAHTLRSEGHDASEDGTGRGVPLVASTLPASTGGVSSGMHPVVAATLRSRQHSPGVPMPGRGEEYDANLVVAFAQNERDEVREIGGNIAGALPAQPGTKQQTYLAFQESQSGFRERDIHATLDSNNGSRRHQGVMARSGVRRLTPVECARLQGFPDDWLAGFSDSAQYRMLGNAVSVPVSFWIGKRMMKVDGEK